MNGHFISIIYDDDSYQVFEYLYSRFVLENHFIEIIDQEFLPKLIEAKVLMESINNNISVNHIIHLFNEKMLCRTCKIENMVKVDFNLDSLSYISEDYVTKKMIAEFFENERIKFIVVDLSGYSPDYVDWRELISENKMEINYVPDLIGVKKLKTQKELSFNQDLKIEKIEDDKYFLYSKDLKKNLKDYTTWPNTGYPHTIFIDRGSKEKG